MNMMRRITIIVIIVFIGLVKIGHMPGQLIPLVIKPGFCLTNKAVLSGLVYSVFVFNYKRLKILVRSTFIIILSLFALVSITKSSLDLFAILAIIILIFLWDILGFRIFV